jgi:hypothetical protein
VDLPPPGRPMREIAFDGKPEADQSGL